MKDGKYEKWCVGRCMMIYITALKHPVRCISLIYLKVENFHKYLFSIRENQNVISTNILLVILLKNIIYGLICYIVNRLIINYDRLCFKQKKNYNNSFRLYGLSLEYGKAYFAAYVERFCCVITIIAHKESKSHYYTICMMLLGDFHIRRIVC